MARLRVDLYTVIDSPLRFRQKTPKLFPVNQGKFMAAVNRFRLDARGDRLKAVDDALIAFHCFTTHGRNYKVLRHLAEVLLAALDTYIKAKRDKPKEEEFGRRMAAEALRAQVVELVAEMNSLDEAPDFRNRPDHLTEFDYRPKVDVRAFPCVAPRGGTLFELPSGLPN